MAPYGALLLTNLAMLLHHVIQRATPGGAHPTYPHIPFSNHWA